MLHSLRLRSTLLRLNLRDNGITQNGMHKLCRGLAALSLLTELNLEENAFGEAGLRCFVSMLSPNVLPRLGDLRMRGNFGSNWEVSNYLYSGGSLWRRMRDEGCLPLAARPLDQPWRPETQDTAGFLTELAREDVLYAWCYSALAQR